MEFENKGKRWTLEEDKQLIELINENKNYDEISKIYKRTTNAIIRRVISHIIYPSIINIEYDIEELSNKYNIEKDFLDMNIMKIKNENISEKIIKSDKINVKTINNNLILIDKKITEINDKLDKLAINLNLIRTYQYTKSIHSHIYKK